MERASVLLVDDRQLISERVAHELERHCRLQRAVSLKTTTAVDVDVLLLPYPLAVSLPAALRTPLGPRVVALAPRPLITDLARAMRTGVHDVVLDPTDTDALVLAIADAYEERCLLLDLDRFQRDIPVPASFARLLGTSPAMVVLRARLAELASTDQAVLITGPSGGGNSLVGSSLHEAGSRRGEPLLEAAASGGQLPDALAGTLLLNEVGDLPLAQQASLLRLLERRELRVLATSSSELAHEVKSGRLREDLYRRLAEATLYVPALKERGKDVLLLAQHFVTLHGKGRVTGLTPAAARALLEYAWPGNVRELERSLITAIGVARADHVGEADLPRSLRKLPLPETSSAALEPLDAIEREHIVRTLRAVDGNKALAARILELDRKTLLRKLQAYEELAAQAKPSA